MFYMKRGQCENCFWKLHVSVKSPGNIAIHLKIVFSYIIIYVGFLQDTTFSLGNVIMIYNKKRDQSCYHISCLQLCQCDVQNMPTGYLQLTSKSVGGSQVF